MASAKERNYEYETLLREEEGMEENSGPDTESGWSLFANLNGLDEQGVDFDSFFQSVGLPLSNSSFNEHKTNQALREQVQNAGQSSDVPIDIRQDGYKQPIVQMHAHQTLDVVSPYQVGAKRSFDEVFGNVADSQNKRAKRSPTLKEYYPIE